MLIVYRLQIAHLHRDRRHTCFLINLILRGCCCRWKILCIPTGTYSHRSYSHRCRHHYLPPQIFHHPTLYWRCCYPILQMLLQYTTNVATVYYRCCYPILQMLLQYATDVATLYYRCCYTILQMLLHYTYILQMLLHYTTDVTCRGVKMEIICTQCVRVKCLYLSRLQDVVNKTSSSSHDEAFSHAWMKIKKDNFLLWTENLIGSHQTVVCVGVARAMC